jgi:hypothetical protein
LAILTLCFAACGGQIGAPYGQPLPGREDVSVTEYRAHVAGGLSDEVAIALPAGTESALLEVAGTRGQYRLAQLTAPSGDDLVESGGFQTRDAREVAGLVDWLYPNSPSLRMEAGSYRLRFTAIDAGGAAVGDEDVTVRVYSRARSREATGGRLHLDVLVADDALGSLDAETAAARLVDGVAAVYAQAAIEIAEYTVTPVHLASPDLTLDGGRASASALDAVRTALASARPNALHLVVVRSLDDGSGPVAGYSLGLPGPVDASRPTAAVLVAAGAFASPSDGTIDLTGMAVTCAHEIGHYLGLYHTSERDGRQHDPIPDTPECAGAGPCSDAGNIMFWTGGAGRSTLTEGQASVMRAHPLCEAGDPLPPPPPDCGDCGAPDTCVRLGGAPRCLRACAPDGDPCPESLSCTTSDDGTYVCR